MYLPAHFAENRLDVLHDAIRGAGLATLVTTGPGGLDACHLPLLLENAPAPLGTLLGHVARANPIWRETPPASEALVLFLGPDAYVTPTWYATKRVSGKVVPTWNYLAIHATGRVRFFQDRAQLLEVVTRLTDRHERTRTAPWEVTDAPADYVETMLGQIVGVELAITRLEGKWKASQNRNQADREGVSAGLADEGHAAMARLVRGPNRDGAGI
jgi:transcriptional regulator